jgi:hypothetical protein
MWGTCPDLTTIYMRLGASLEEHTQHKFSLKEKCASLRRRHNYKGGVFSWRVLVISWSIFLGLVLRYSIVVRVSGLSSGYLMFREISLGERHCTC